MPLDALPLICRADIRPNSFNAQARTVTVVWSTGAPVQRRDARGPYTEVLSLAPEHVNLGRLRDASVLDGHRQGGVRDVIGAVTEARIENGVGVATVKLSGRDDIAPVIRDIADGILRHVSIGYVVDKWAEAIDSKGARIRTAVAWAPHEISFVPVPADPGAQTRGGPMPDTVIPETTQQVIPPANTATRAEINSQIRSVATLAGLDTAFADGLIDREATVEHARAAAFEAMQTRQTTTIRTQQIGPSNDDPTVINTRMVGALAARMGVALDDASRPYMNMGLIDMARAMLLQRGVAGVAMLSREEILTRAQHTISDFPELLTGAGNRVLQSAYQLAASPIKSLARQRTAVDFRPLYSLSIGDFDTLAEVTESGEITGTSTAEAKESYALTTKARIFRLSRKAMINDDLGALGQWNSMMGKASAETENQMLLNLLTQSAGAGPLMGDGVRLFHANHGNLAAVGAEPDIASLSAARLAMRHQKGLEGKMPVNVAPKFILAPAELETRFEQLIAQTQTVGWSDANPFAGKLTLLVESRLQPWAWYLFADTAAAPVLEYAYLSSAQGPQLASRDGFDVLGREFRVVLDFGCGATDHRGAYRQPGAELTEG